MQLDRKQVDDVLGGKDAFVGAKEATVQEGCRECGHKKAYFMEIQIRSADEPMTIFFRCVNCAYQWKENWLDCQSCLVLKFLLKLIQLVINLFDNVSELLL